ncbi:MAG: ATP-dependent nuclease [Chloroflexota bacterium]
MFISKVNIKNFKCFSSQEITFNRPNSKPGSGLNILIGENNCGKSTVFEAIDFFRNGTDKNLVDLKNTNAKQNDDLLVEITFAGKIPDTIEDFSQENKKKVFRKYLFKENTEDHIKFLRTSDDLKSIKLWDNENQQYINESGIDAPIKKLFEFNFVWADTNPNDQIKFGASTVCGNLLKKIIEQFEDTNDFSDFKDHYDMVFNNPESTLKKRLNHIEEKTKEKFSEQFGNASILFHFEHPKVETFFKNSSIRIDDGLETSLAEKGSGMQRSVALALLQVYAEELIKHPEKDVEKPFFLFIDEPEICLHPKAQIKLFNALLELSKTQQIFIATHSPYFFKCPYIKDMAIFVCKRVDNYNVIINNINNDHFKLFPWSPSWGEINYYAYNMPTIEFHNELYGQLQYISNSKTIDNADKYIQSQGISVSKKWQREDLGKPGKVTDVTIQTFIRNKIHHPENQLMLDSNFTEQEFELSIAEMIELLSQKEEPKNCEREDVNPLAMVNIENSLEKDFTKQSSQT